MMKNGNKLNTGFALIEILVYLGLFVILMGGAVVSAYSIFESSGRNQTRIMIQEEGNFLLSKFNWALSGIQSINAPSEGTTGSVLSITKSDTSIGAIDIGASSGDVVMTRSGITKILNNSNVSVSGLIFEYQNQNDIEWVKSKFTLNTKTPDGKTISKDFETTKYIRK